jgi:glycogen operon protein
LLTDPYAFELSHDPETPKGTQDGTVYASGPQHRLADTGRVAPKGIVLKPDQTDYGAKPLRPFRDEIIYEVHLRGLTKLDPNIAAAEQGTYRGAARKIDYLKTLGVTAVEFLPIHETDNDDNDIAPNSANYWGYATLDYFAPDRRYSSDKSPGGPTREFKQMVKVFHEAGIKVYLDVVFNHTGEGNLYNGNDPTTANLLSWRGLDNATYYELRNGNQTYCDNTGAGANFNCAGKVVRNEVLDSLAYWSKAMGVDGFRFDLAPILGNTLDHQRGDGLEFLFDKLPGDNPRPPNGGTGVDLIAEPWGSGGNGNSQQQGNFPLGWAEWNDAFRYTIRASQNRLGFEDVTPGQLATRFAGSSDRFQNNGRKPWHSVNQIVAHDGFCLRDLYRFSSNDGRRAWDQGGDLALQRQATRNGFALPMVSAGVPMFTGGDEFGRTQNNNDNPYNIDNSTNYLDWSLLNVPEQQSLNRFARLAIGFRRTHPALRPPEFFQGADHNGNGLKDVTWYRDDGQEADPGYMTANDRHFLAYRVDGTEVGDPAASVYVGYNSWLDTVNITLPKPLPGKAWLRAADTAAWMEPQGNFKDPGQEDALTTPAYAMHGRSLLLLIER